MAYRHAIYYAPPPETRLERLGMSWLGRDHRTGQKLARPALPGLPPERLEALTASARRYGFHGTLKAPFRLADGMDASLLRNVARVFAATRRPFTLPPLTLADMKGFLALVPSAPAPELDALAADCVSHFEPFRASLTLAELARRRRGLLTRRQDAQLVAYGYPYVFADFAFHLTLTDRLQPADKALVMPHLEALTADVRAEPFTVEAIAIYVEPAPGADFLLESYYPFMA